MNYYAYKGPARLFPDLGGLLQEGDIVATELDLSDRFGDDDTPGDFERSTAKAYKEQATARESAKMGAAESAGADN